MKHSFNLKTSLIIIGALCALVIAYAVNLTIMATQQPQQIPVATHTESGLPLKDLPPSFKIGECQVYKITVDSTSYLIVESTRGACAIIKHEPKQLKK